MERWIINYFFCSFPKGNKNFNSDSDIHADKRSKYFDVMRLYFDFLFSPVLIFNFNCYVTLVAKQREAFCQRLSSTVWADRLDEGQRGQSKATFPLSALALGSS